MRCARSFLCCARGHRIMVSPDDLVALRATACRVVTIGGQRSVTPTTNYGAPEIYRFGGAGMADASTDGGDVITIDGGYFSLQRFLDQVTFGPSGSEFAATGCSVTIPHKRLTCTLPPGVGRALKWCVAAVALAVASLVSCICSASRTTQPTTPLLLASLSSAGLSPWAASSRSSPPSRRATRRRPFAPSRPPTRRLTPRPAAPTSS